MLVSTPEDYGLNAESTLDHRADTDRPEGFETFWADFREDCLATGQHWVGSTDETRNQIWIPSLRSIRVCGDLWMPNERPTAAVITLHGYVAEDNFDAEPDPWFASGIASLRIRVRGYPPSTRDIDDLRTNWIRNGLDTPESWIVRGAVGDVVQAVRTLRMALGPDIPIMLRGDSFGGGLAVLASAQLQEMHVPIDHLIIGFPTFGDWRWRRDRYCNGSGGEVNAFLESMRSEADALLERLRLFDATLHAPDVTTPTLALLALRDDTVPAPTAAAIVNALGSSELRRFLVRYGHYDGGIADGRRHIKFARAVNACVTGGLEEVLPASDLAKHNQSVLQASC
ncbi:MAG: acetylxylan esterase [Planctomycetota bacterium]